MIPFVRPALALLAAAVLSTACAPSAAPRVVPAAPGAAAVAQPAADTAAPDTVQRPLLRAVPVPPNVRRAVARGTRTASGAPGAAYTQQRVRYRIDAELDPRSAVLRGAEQIVYRNRSADTLSSIVLNLYHNIFAEGVPRNRYAPITGGIKLKKIVSEGRTLKQRPAAELPVVPEPPRDAPPGFAVQGTLGRVILSRPLLPGDSTMLQIEWQTRVPPAGTFRTAWQDTLGGRAFQVAQWYPQIATYDDLDGWDVTPYLGDGEFYLEYGDFDVSLTVPAGYLVGATGVLQNADEVLTEEALRRLAAALRSDSVTAIVTAADVEVENATVASPEEQLTWRFRARDVRDFAFATSNRYVWDASRSMIPDGEGGTRPVAVHALYRPGAAGWSQAARYGRHAVGFFSRQLVPNLYPQITIAEGSVGGMEYPQLVFIGKPRTPEALYSVIAHEIGHQWFPMMIGSDEARYAWMDEGVTSFYEALARNDFFPASDAFAGDRGSYLAVAGAQAEVPLMRHTDLVSPYGARGVAAYTKPATLLRSLRSVLGDSIFDLAMTTYAREWLLGHPTPWDFFNTVERVASRDLDWFFYPWWFETGTLDQAITGVASTGNRTVVTVHDRGEIPAPSPLVGTTASGRRVETVIPIDTWLRGVRTATAVLEAAEPIVRIEIDPEHRFPDVDPSNNVWTPR